MYMYMYIMTLCGYASCNSWKVVLVMYCKNNVVCFFFLNFLITQLTTRGSSLCKLKTCNIAVVNLC